MNDRLEALAIFVAVAEQQSFAEAARQLRRSPASVTRAVSALEERLQTRLLNRTTRSVALTDAGARYLENCRRLLSTYDELEAVNLGERVQPRGWINVTAPTMFGRLHVLHLAIRRFRPTTSQLSAKESDCTVDRIASRRRAPSRMTARRAGINDKRGAAAALSGKACAVLAGPQGNVLVGRTMQHRKRRQAIDTGARRVVRNEAGEDDRRADIRNGAKFCRHGASSALIFAHEWSNSRRTVTRFGGEVAGRTTRTGELRELPDCRCVTE